MNNNSPLESLAAFAIAFATGIASALAMSAYIRQIKKKSKMA